LRLSFEQRSSIKKVIGDFLTTHEHAVYLYGSRAEDTLKGGDIDLLIVTSNAGIQVFNQKWLDILVALKKRPEIGERRIDLKATTKDLMEKDPFLNSIKNQCVLI
jgi:predicted nucleotidyltransferase